jgi:predicted amidophosphoribosyltransferase
LKAAFATKLVPELRELARDGIQGLLHLFYPLNCGACGAVMASGDRLFCLTCEADLPEPGYHRLDAEAHPMARRFWGRLELEGVWACWTMKSAGPVRELLHRLKYHNRPDLARGCGRYYGALLMQDGVFQGIQAIAYVPMAPAKEAARGYNPAKEIALGLAEASGLPVRHKVLIRRSGGKTQTHKDRFERWESVRRLYGPGPDLARLHPGQGSHLLLVDDVMTTGATFEACGSLLLEAGFKLTIAALAAAE